MAASFLDDVVFPVAISKGSAGGPDWMVQITELASGLEERNTPWAAPVRRYDARWGVRSREELYDILQLYHVAHGALYGFRLLDWTDDRSGPPHHAVTAFDQVIGTGDGTRTTFDLVKHYVAGTHSFIRRIHKPIEGTVQVALGGTPASPTIDHATGIVSFASPPTPGVSVTAGFRFHVPVRFDAALDQIVTQGEYGDIPSIPLKEIKL